MPTTTVARRALARELGPFGVVVVSDAAASGPDNARWIISRGTTGVAARSMLRPAESWKGAWASVVTGSQAGQARRIASALPGLGAFAADAVFSGILQVGVEVELSHSYPSVAQHDEIGLLDLLNWGLRHLVFEDRYSLAVTTSDEYSLSATQFLDRSDRLAQVLEPSPISGRAPIDAKWRGWKLVLDGELPKLRFDAPFGAATGNLEIVVRRPADSWIAVASTWAPSSVGLSAESDEAKPDLVHMVEAAKVLAFQIEAQRAPDAAASAPLWDRYERQLAVARALPFWDGTRDDLSSAGATATSTEKVA